MFYTGFVFAFVFCFYLIMGDTPNTWDLSTVQEDCSTRSITLGMSLRYFWTRGHMIKISNKEFILIKIFEWIIIRMCQIVQFQFYTLACNIWFILQSSQFSQKIPGSECLVIAIYKISDFCLLLYQDQSPTGLMKAINNLYTPPMLPLPWPVLLKGSWTQPWGRANKCFIIQKW